MYIPFLLACILTHDAVSAMTNVTVDDSDALILYNPPSDWGVSVVSSLDYNGTHHLSQNSSASAIFTFTGSHAIGFRTKSQTLNAIPRSRCVFSLPKVAIRSDNTTQS
jgi:hypothetical protein